jgi:hypothetical protein
VPLSLLGVFIGGGAVRTKGGLGSRAVSVEVAAPAFASDFVGAAPTNSLVDAGPDGYAPTQPSAVPDQSAAYEHTEKRQESQD